MLERKNIYWIILIVLYACNEPTKVVENKINEGVYPKGGRWKENKNGASANGFYLYIQSKDTSEYFTILDGLKEGIEKNFYSNNKINEIRFYKNNLKTGTHIAYWPSGIKRFETQYLEGEFHGTRKEWNPFGALVLEMHYEMGHESGSQKVWYDTGKIKTNYVMLDGRRYGLLGTKNCVNVIEKN